MFFNKDVKDIVESHSLTIDIESARVILRTFNVPVEIPKEAYRIINSIFVFYPNLKDEFLTLVEKMNG